jgi:hypothetical protein
MGKRGRIIPTKVKFNRDKKRPEKQAGKPKKKSNYSNSGLNFNTPSLGFNHMKKPENKGQKSK